jgi:hypothetical protein
MGRLRESRGEGVVFTPAPLARRLVRDWVRALPEDVPLLDPACGDGALLLAALEALGGGAEAGARLHGFELDPARAQRARERLASAGGGSHEELAARVRCADALAPELRWPAGSAVLANPPWVSFSGRQAAKSSRRPSERSGWPSLQGAFLERIAQHCETSGRGARLLLPASLLDLPRYEASRARAFEHVHLARAPEDLGEGAFPGVLAPAVLVELRPGPCPPSERPPDALSRGLTDLLARRPLFPAGTFADPGVHTGNSAADLVSSEPRPGWAPLRRGADLQPYALGAASLHLRLDLPAAPGRRFRIPALEHSTGFPLLLRQTARRPLAALHTAPTYFRNSLLAVRPVNDLAPELVLALLNSPLSGAWLRLSFRDARQRSFPQMKVGALQTLPMPFERRADAAGLHDEVVARVRKLDPQGTSFPGELQALDALVARAYGLPERLADELARSDGILATPAARGRSRPS